MKICYQKYMRDSTALERSRALRRSMTPPERALWYRLKLRQIDGIKFRRQAAIGPYIADFVSHEIMLVVELDGDSHGDPQSEEHDARRTAFLRSEGFMVLRFWNAELRESIEGVVERIREACRIAKGR